MKKYIKDFSNYTISDSGVITSYKNKKPKTMKQSISANGYKVVGLVGDNNVRKLMSVHRLVGLHFISNDENYLVINHKDGNKTNNCVSNLEWCTSEHNNKHAFDSGLNNGIGSGKNNHKSKAIDQLSLDGEYIQSFESARIAAKELGNKSQGNISMVCREERPNAYGFKWRFSKS